MKVCAACGRENADDARFCSGCGAPFGPAAQAVEERKIVTCLFCDLVGFTARAEQLDPEDVRRLLEPYHVRVRSELERYGGTVEKFIGDAVMAVFGAPIAHEDDPERAVRAALAIRDGLAEDGELEVRIGITTGEALVSLGARPLEGEGMAAGDVVNTAARLQAGAPADTILVDETTYRATARAVRFNDGAPIRAKGKAEPIPVWQALEARSRMGVDVRQLSRTALVGRTDELEVLDAALARARRTREPQLVTLVGVPGIGKSRLVWELLQSIERERELTGWRQGRSLPYGEGVSFWALGEMVKAQAGVLETDDAERTEAKLRESIASITSDEDDARWLESHLRPLVGLEVTPEAGAGRRDETFAAWRHYFEVLAETRPLVLVFEDLHWADDSLLDFIDYLVEWASGFPILVVATARLELLTRRPGWGGGKPNGLTLSLSPLSDTETAALIHALLDRAVLPAEVQQALIERAGGNPLYAEEFVRMLDERRGDEHPLPETVQGLIAARLDGLPPDEKALLQGAAVLGKVFWLGSATELAGVERRAAEESLHALERKEFVRRERRSSVAGEVEYAFRHLLVREVAYGQIPRAVRADKHRVAAHWIESLGRTEDHAETLAHHYVCALELSCATGRPIADITDRARHALVEAGHRAFSLNGFPVAARFYAEALELGFGNDTDRVDAQYHHARALSHVGREDHSTVLEEARDALLAIGDLERAAEMESLLAEFWWHRGNRDRSRRHLERGYAIVRDLPPSSGKAHVLSQVARYRALAEENVEAIEVGQEALAMADALGLDELTAHALDNIGIAKFQLGDLTGIEDVERSIEIALAARSPEAARACNNLGAFVWTLGDFRRSCELMDKAIALGEKLGNELIHAYSRNVRTEQLVLEGRWDEALRAADAFVAVCETGESHYQEGGVRLARAWIRLGREDPDGALEDIRKALAPARAAGDPQAVAPTLAGAARLLLDAGETEKARELADEALAGRSPPWSLADLAWIAPELGLTDQLAHRLEGADPRKAWTEVMSLLLEGDFLAVAEQLAAMGVLLDEAFARQRGAERLVRRGRHTEADEQLRRSLAFWRFAGATRYIREGEARLAAAS